MKQIIFIILVLSLLPGCSSTDQGSSNLLDQINTLEVQNETSPDKSKSTQLLNLYSTYVKENPDDKKNNAAFLYRAATLNYRMNQYSPAAKLLSQAIKDYYSSENTPNATRLLANIYKDNFRNPTVANVINQAYVAAFPNDPNIAKVQSLLATDIAALEENIKTLGQNLYSENNGQINFQNANNFISTAEFYAMMLPTAEQAPEFLYTASQVAGSIRAHQKAIEIYDWILEKFPGSERAPKALFLKAFTLDNELKKYDEAKPVYEAFLSKYPNDEFAESAKFSLDNLGKPIEELIKNFPQQEETN